jgi:hypothetical protein
MNVGDKVVCIDASYGFSYGLKKGEIYTIAREYAGCYYLIGIDGGWFSSRFRPLEEMQNTNFIRVAK